MSATRPQPAPASLIQRRTAAPNFSYGLVPFDLQDDEQRRGTRILRAFFTQLTNRHTRLGYAEDLRVFTRFMRGVYQEPLSPAQLVDRFLFGGGTSPLSNFGHANMCADYFRAWQLKLDRSTGTINRRLTMLRGLTAAARRLGLLTWSLEIKGLRNETRQDTRGPLPDDVKRLFDYVTALNTPIAVRDIAIIRLLHDLGLRRSEVARLDVGHLNFHDETIAVQGKARRELVYLSLPQPTQTALQAWLTIRGMTPGPLFLLAVGGLGAGRFYQDKRITGFAIYKLIRTYGRTLGLKLRPHGFRHTAITTAMISAAELRIPFEEVMQFSRHRHVTTLMRYRDFLDNRQPALAAKVAEHLTHSTPKAPAAASHTTVPNEPSPLRLTLAEDEPAHEQ